MEISKEDIRKYIQIIALDNLINTLEEALENEIIDPDSRELAIQIINESRNILSEYSQDIEPETKIKRPVWKQ